MDKKIKKRIAVIASQTEIATMLGYKPQTVSLWFKGKVPSKNVRSLCEALGWEITPHELRPDLYPNPTDGLPTEKAA